MSTAVHSLSMDMSSGEKALHPFFTGSVVAKHDAHTSCEESPTIAARDQSVESKNRRRSKRQRPVEDVPDLHSCAQGNQHEPNGTSMSQSVSHTKRRRVSKEAQAKKAGPPLSDSGLDTMSRQAAAAMDVSSRMKASSDSGVSVVGSSASTQKCRQKSTASKLAENEDRAKPYVLADITGLDRKIHLSEDGPSLMQEVESPEASTCPTSLDSIDMQASGSTCEDCPVLNAHNPLSTGSLPDAEARGHGTVTNPNDVHTLDSDRVKDSQYAPIFLPRRRSVGSDTLATKPSSIPRSKKGRSRRKEVAQMEESRASSECSDLSKRRTLLVILRYHPGSRTAFDRPEQEQEKTIAKDVVDLTVDEYKSPPIPKVSKRSTKPLHPFFLGRTTKQPDSAANKILHRLSADASLSDDKQVTSGSDTDRGTKHSARMPDSTNKNLGLGFAAAFGGGALGTGTRKSTVKFPGAIEAPWPARDMVHIRGFEAGRTHEQENSSKPFAVTMVRSYQKRSQRKQKNNALQIPQNEDILQCLARKLSQKLDTHGTGLAGPETNGQKPQSSSALRLPERTVLTGSALKVHLRHELRTPISAIDRGSAEVLGDGSPGFKSYAMERHPALLKLYRSVGKSFTPFDLSICETQQWSVKYAPSSADEVLQPGSEVMVLRHWLRNVALSPTDTGRSKSKRGPGPGPLTADKKQDAEHKRRVSSRKRRSDELCDFIVSSGDESDGMEELSGPGEDYDYPPMPRSVVRGGAAAAISEPGRTNMRATTAVLISGPPGCGKTAAAYAVAKELDFEVFEINPGSRRNGKDLLERVGDLTTNHLVRRSKDSFVANNALEASSLPHTAGSAADLDRPKVSPIGSFFKAQRDSKQGPERASKSGTSADTSKSHQPPRVQKQSLILLEEVDVLFEEDKTFWATVLGLLSQSKRPIIMTCNDENLVPADALPLHGILRFRPPPTDLAVDYLLLLAGAEGHLLRRPAVEALYRSKRRDLRASIMEIDFWCQMAVGDQKAGLEWMHPRCPSWDDGFAGLDALHVASKDTYLRGMGWTSRDAVMEKAGDPSAVEQELLHEAWNHWDMDVEDWCSGSDIRSWADSFASNVDGSSSKMFPACCALDQFYDWLSSADVFSGQALGAGMKIPLDATQPALPDRVRFDTVQGHSLLEVDPAIGYDGLSTDMALSTKVLAKRLLLAVKDECSEDAQPHLDSFNEENLIELVTNRAQQETSRHQVTRTDLSAAFDPISEASGSAPAVPGLLQSSEFDRTSSLIVEDLAPYVRAIVLHDMRLEDQRRQIQEQSRKRLRTTRASRSALEGGDRSSIRRNKWFEGDLDPDVVLKTGSQEWYQAAAAKSESG